MEHKNVTNIINHDIARKYDPEKLDKFQVSQVYKEDDGPHLLFFYIAAVMLGFVMGVIVMRIVSPAHAEERKSVRRAQVQCDYTGYQSQIYQLNLELLAAKKTIFDLRAQITGMQGQAEAMQACNRAYLACFNDKALVTQQLRQCLENR